MAERLVRRIARLLRRWPGGPYRPRVPSRPGGAALHPLVVVLRPDRGARSSSTSSTGRRPTASAASRSPGSTRSGTAAAGPRWLEPRVDRAGRPRQAACRATRPGLRLHLRHALALRRLVRPAGGRGTRPSTAPRPSAWSRSWESAYEDEPGLRPQPPQPRGPGPLRRGHGPALAPALAGRTSALFCDSWEVPTRRMWSPRLWDRFRERFGYDLRDVRGPARRGRARPLRLPHADRRGGPGRVLPAVRGDLPRPRGRLPRAVPRGADRPAGRLRGRRHPRDGGPAVPARRSRGSRPRPPRWPASRSSAARPSPASTASRPSITSGSWPRPEAPGRRPRSPTASTRSSGTACPTTRRAGRTPSSPRCTSAPTPPSPPRSPPSTPTWPTVCSWMRRGRTCSQLAVYLPIEDNRMLRPAAAPSGARPAAQYYWEMRHEVVPREAEPYHPLWISAAFLRGASWDGRRLHAGAAEFEALLPGLRLARRRGAGRRPPPGRGGAAGGPVGRPRRPGRGEPGDYEAKLDALLGLPNVQRASWRAWA